MVRVVSRLVSEHIGSPAGEFQSTPLHGTVVWDGQRGCVGSESVHKLTKHSRRALKSRREGKFPWCCALYQYDLRDTTSAATQQVVALVRCLNDVYRKAYDGTFESSTLAFQGQCEELTAWGKALSATMPVCMVQSRNNNLPCYQDAWQLQDQLCFSEPCI